MHTVPLAADFIRYHSLGMLVSQVRYHSLVLLAPVGIIGAIIARRWRRHS